MLDSTAQRAVAAKLFAFFPFFFLFLFFFFFFLFFSPSLPLEPSEVISADSAYSSIGMRNNERINFHARTYAHDSAARS